MDHGLRTKKIPRAIRRNKNTKRIPYIFPRKKPVVAKKKNKCQWPCEFPKSNSRFHQPSFLLQSSHYVPTLRFAKSAVIRVIPPCADSTVIGHPRHPRVFLCQSPSDFHYQAGKRGLVLLGPPLDPSAAKTGGRWTGYQCNVGSMANNQSKKKKKRACCSGNFGGPEKDLHGSSGHGKESAWGRWRYQAKKPVPFCCCRVLLAEINADTK